MNAIELLKADHRKVDHLFGKVKASEEGEHKELFEQIKQELEVHTHIEETIFYPKLKEEKELEDITHHVQEEEGEMFPKVEELFDEATLQELGKQMEAEKQSFQKSNKASAGK